MQTAQPTVKTLKKLKRDTQQEPKPTTEQTSEPKPTTEQTSEPKPTTEPTSEQTSEPKPTTEPRQEIRLVDIPINDENTALNVMVGFLNVAHKRGAFTIDETAKIWECISKFQKI